MKAAHRIASVSSLPFLIACCMLASMPRAAAQGSDDCSTAQVIAGSGPHVFDTTLATAGAEGQINGCGLMGTAVDADVWFSWTAPQTGTVHFSTCGQTSVDTKIGMYSGTTCPTSANPDACSDDNCAVQSQTTLFVTAGTPYLIQIGSSPFSPGGTGTFVLDFTQPHTSSDCGLPEVIAGTGTFLYDSGGAGPSPQQPGSGCAGITADVWFLWTAPATGTATLSTCGQTSIDTSIAVYIGNTCPTAHSIACDDDACGLQSWTSWQAVAGADYMFQVGSAGGFSAGIGTITVEVLSTPANDDCSTPVNVGTGGSSYDTTHASMGAEGQSNPCGPIFNDLWFEWTAASSGWATIETCGQTSSDTALAVYPAGGCPAGVADACDNDGCGQQSTLSFAVTAGSTWLVQVGDGAPSGGGAGSFTTVIGPPPMTPYCAGDGTNALCPCMNFGASGRGCANSVDASGALLAGSGTASVSSDSVVLQGSGMPNAACLYLQGSDKDSFGFGTPLFDGIRCVAGTIVRLGTLTNVANGSQYPGPGDPLVSVRGGVPPTGGTLHYQIWYRNAAAAFCPPETANWSNGLEVLWIP